MDVRLLGEMRAAAERAATMTWVPYSNFAVLASVATVDGRVYGGSNVEIANLSLSKHAEESAVLAALSDGALGRVGRRWLAAVYVAADRPVFPCGSCRQLLWEFAADGCTVAIADRDAAGDVRVFLLSELLPHPFGPEDLGVTARM